MMKYIYYYLVKIMNKYKDVRFGGFTMRTWEVNCLKKIDNNAFMFSLDNNTIYEVIKNEPDIPASPNLGMYFFDV